MEEGMDVGDAFDSYEDFEKALEAYCERENVQYTITDSKTTKSENLKVKRLYDEKFRFRFVKYECKHGPKNKKKKVKGHGLRPNQRTFNIECKSTLIASIDRESNKFTIRQHIKTHNHECSKELFQHYPEQRRRLKVAVKDQTEIMLKMGVKVKTLQQYLKTQHNHFLTVKDLHNIRQQTKQSSSGKTEEDILLEDLEEICKLTISNFASH